MRLQDKVAIVTGAGGEIGGAIAATLAHEGARAAVVDVRGERAKQRADAIKSAGGVAEAYTVDATSAADWQRLVSSLIERWGRIDVLCNNAGILIAALVADMSEEDWDRQIDVNLKSMFLGCKYVIPEMIKAGGGSIVNTGSVNSFVAEPFIAAYCASKGGVLMLTKAIALDHAKHNIRCNCVCPALVDTPLNLPQLALLGGHDKILAEVGNFMPIGRALLPEEIANAVLFLASDESSAFTGSALAADGGLMAQ
jgi:dihydroanticapsin dehydrogenase